MTLEKIIQNNLCTGCGVCISEDESGSSRMEWNEDGFLVPRVTNNSSFAKMEKVCPFNIKNEFDEDYLAKKFIRNYKYSDDDIGLYTNLYAGYSVEYRNTSSSGGLATYVFEKLLRNGFVDHLFIVKEINGRYGYQLFSSVDRIKEISKTRYYPVTMDSLFSEINKIDGRVAVSGVACFIKAIRLKQKFDPDLEEKIPFLIGIICGGLKNKYYTDFLAQSAGCSSDYSSPEYRVKNAESIASDYKFSCESKRDNRIHVVEMQRLGDMWGSGLFKSNACDYCDDVTTELADISLGDAWIKPYNQEGLGNSIIITRSQFADEIIMAGIDDNSLKLDIVNVHSVKSSQQGSFNHRHKGLQFRIKQAKRNGFLFPKKRSRFLNKQNLFFNSVQRKRLLTREKSITIWNEEKSILSFNKRFHPFVTSLIRVTKRNHMYLRIKVKLMKLIGFNK
ncbi:Coenzyme F420 hydrogenase/dehydrogenase, beta subunit C-terminal domain [Serratia fonticola]